MDRVEKSREKFQQLFGDHVPAAYFTDPEFQDFGFPRALNALACVNEIIPED